MCSVICRRKDRTYLVGFEEDPGNGKAELPYVFGQARWSKNGKRYPVWADDPAECWQRGFIPISLLRPEDIRDEIDQWIEKAIPDDTPDKFAAYKTISGLISDLRINVREFNLPYLALPAKTPKEVALDVFIKMNTSSVKLSTYDVVVALVEDETGKSLHEHVDALAAAVPRATDYADLPSLVLDVVALRQDRVPSQAGYRGIDYTRMLTEWDSVVKGIQGMVSFLEDESIFDDQRLPSYTAFPIIAAIWEYLPTHPDQLGNARHLLRIFLWRAFLTSRYEQSSTTSIDQQRTGQAPQLAHHAIVCIARSFPELDSRLSLYSRLETHLLVRVFRLEFEQDRVRRVAMIRHTNGNLVGVKELFD